MTLLLENEKATKDTVDDLKVYQDNLTEQKREFRRDYKKVFPGIGRLKLDKEELRRLKKNGDLRQE